MKDIEKMMNFLDSESWRGERDIKKQKLMTLCEATKPELISWLYGKGYRIEGHGKDFPKKHFQAKAIMILMDMDTVKKW